MRLERSAGREGTRRREGVLVGADDSSAVTDYINIGPQLDYVNMMTLCVP